MAKKSVRLPKTKTKRKEEKYLLRLYITGNAPQSTRAIINLKRICEEHLKDRYDLEIIDIYKRPELAKDEQIIAAPTLIKSVPPPFKKLIGDLSNEEKVLLGLNIRPTKKVSAKIDPDGC
ncbi:MAG: circadian clock KaiB family protein [Bdellovibrionota bacterium]